MTPAQIAELERLDREAHPAPWTWGRDTCVLAAEHVILDVQLGTHQDKALLTIARNVLPQLLSERAGLQGVLRELEWSRRSEATGSVELTCPICVGSYGRHHTGCRLAAALSRAGGKAEEP